jgi:hypothetical protein
VSSAAFITLLLLLLLLPVSATITPKGVHLCSTCL